MSVKTVDVPSYNTLLEKELIPSSVFIKDLTFNSRNVIRYSSDSMVGVSDRFPSTQVARFTLSASDSILYNLDEFFLNIAGEGYFKKNGAQISNKIDKFEGIQIPPYWWIACLNSIEVTIGGVQAWYKNNLINYVNFYTSNYHDFDQRQLNELTNEGIYKMNTFKVPEEKQISTTPPTYALESLEDTGVYTSMGVSAAADISKLYTSQSKPFNFQLCQPDGTYDGFKFQLIIPLHDLLPEVSTMCCIWNQPIQIALTFADNGYTLIQPLNVDYSDSAIITKFEAFNLNAVSYGLDSTMITKMTQIYSKPVIKVVDQIEYFNNSLNNNISSLDLKVSLNLAFNSDLIQLSFPMCTANNYTIPYSEDNDHITGWQLYDPQNPDKIIYNNTKFTNRFLPIKRINVYADNTLIFARDFGTSTVPTSEDGNPVLNCLSTCCGNDFNDYTYLYDCYKQSRYCTYHDGDKGAVSFEEWLSQYFSVNILTSSFSRISTTANIVVQIIWGSGMKEPDKGHFYVNQVVETSEEKLNVIRTIVKSKKAFCFVPGGRCEVRKIEASFSNDYDLDAITDSTAKMN